MALSFSPHEINAEAFSYYRRLRRVRRYCVSHLDQAIPVATAARIAGLEKHYFCAFFRAKTGVCFHDWLGYLRVQRAKALLSASDTSITHVALAVGFGHLRTFERTFRRHTGRTPRAYRNAVRPS